MPPSHQKFLLRLSALSKKPQRQSSKIACESEAERGRVTEKMLRMPLEEKKALFFTYFLLSYKKKEMFRKHSTVRVRAGGRKRRKNIKFKFQNNKQM